MTVERQPLGLTGVELPPFGLRASRPFDVIGKESQTDRSRLVRWALEHGIDFFASSPAHGEAERILAAGLMGYRLRATVMSTICNLDIAAAYREIDISLHLFDGRIDLLMADWPAASDELLTSFARMRSRGDAAAIGVVCRTLDDLRSATSRIVVEGFDVVCVLATLLITTEVDALLSEIHARRCGLIVLVPDGLEAIRGAGLDDLKVNLKEHGLDSFSDVLVKLALSDARLTSVAVPVRRIRELAHLDALVASPALSGPEMDALRTG